MKIGILTYHRAENYGALLQAYALKTYLQGLGHDVSYIDYWPSYHIEHYSIFSTNRFWRYNYKGKIMYLVNFMVWGLPKSLRKHRFVSFIKNKMQVKGNVKYMDDAAVTEEYDVAIYGSDQIWRRQDIHNNEYNPWYFGSSNVSARKKVAYAASMGIIDADEREKNIIHDWLSRFSALSVRENDLKVFLNSLEYKSELVIDPTFLLSKEEWRRLYKKNVTERYILFYNLLNSKESVKFTNDLSRSVGLPVKEINMRLSFSHVLSKRYIVCASLERFLQLIDCAEYIVSNSFHGVAFSLIFEKQFWALGIGKRANRVMSLLENVGIAERYVNSDFTKDMISSTINYAEVSPRLMKMTNDSKAYLKKAIV